ncbi:hypothetical protein ACJX0J_018081, partial [Zea mays]
LLVTQSNIKEYIWWCSDSYYDYSNGCIIGACYFMFLLSTLFYVFMHSYKNYMMLLPLFKITNGKQVRYIASCLLSLLVYDPINARTQLDLPLNIGATYAFEDYIRLAHKPHFQRWELEKELLLITS